MTTQLEVAEKSREVFAGIRRQFDTRFVHFDVKVSLKAGCLTASGTVHYPQLKSAVAHALSNAFPGLPVDNRIKVLTLDWPLRFALVESPSVMGFFFPNGCPKDATTEMLAGQVVRSFFRKGDWVYCQAPDGYLGWLPKASLRPSTRDYYLCWSLGRRWRLVNPWRGDRKIEYRVGTEFKLGPEGRIHVPGKGVLAELPPGEVVDPSFNSFRSRVIEVARSYLGVPYLWGGRTDRGLDCSGFVQMIYARVGVALPRDANQQANMGLLVGHLDDGADLIPGDLIFFMNGETAKIFHVGISLGGDAFIHSESKNGVNEACLSQRNSSPGHPYNKHFCFGRRIFL